MSLTTVNEWSVATRCGSKLNTDRQGVAIARPTGLPYLIGSWHDREEIISRIMERLMTRRLVGRGALKIILSCRAYFTARGDALHQEGLAITARGAF